MQADKSYGQKFRNLSTTAVVFGVFCSQEHMTAVVLGTRRLPPVFWHLLNHKSRDLSVDTAAALVIMRVQHDALGFSDIIHSTCHSNSSSRPAAVFCLLTGQSTP